MSSLVFSIPAAPATSGAAPASAAGAAAARGRDAKPADDGNGFGAALARMRDGRTRPSDDKAEAGTTTTSPLARRRALATDEQGKESTPADLLAMAMLTPAFSTQAAQQRQAAAAAAGGAEESLQTATDGEASASVDASTLAGTAAQMAAADAQPAAQDKAAKTARAPDEDAPADAAADPKADAKADAATALAAPKTATPPVPVTTPAAATAAPVTPGNSTRDGRSSAASPALAALDGKNPAASTAAQVQAEPSVADQIEGSSASDTSGSNLPAQLAFKTALSEATGNANGNAPAAQSVPRFNVPTPVGSENWGADIGRQMIRMGADGHHVAELNLNPAGLGPLKVTLTLGDGQAQAMFASAHESVRRAVEAALPQLRDTLAGQGIQLGQASVDAGAQQQQQQAFGQQERGFAGALRTPGREAQRGAGEVQAAAPARAAASGSRGGIDTFA